MTIPPVLTEISIKKVAFIIVKNLVTYDFCFVFVVQESDDNQFFDCSNFSNQEPVV